MWISPDFASRVKSRVALILDYAGDMPDPEQENQNTYKTLKNIIFILSVRFLTLL